MYKKVDVNIDSRSFNGLIVFYSVVVCVVVEVIQLFLYYGVNIMVVDKNGFLLLYYVIFYVFLSQFDWEIIWNEISVGGVFYLLKIDWRGCLVCFYEDDNFFKNIEYYRWLDIFIDLILYGFDVDVVDKDG